MCSTAVDENGVHREGSWGYCNSSCPTDGVSECVDSLTHHYDDTDTPK